MRRDVMGAVWAGLALIGLGVMLIVANAIGWEQVWPVFPMLGGVAFWAGFFTGEKRDPGLAFVGTAAFLVGLFFFGFTVGPWKWDQMEVLWPVFVLIGAVAFFVLFLAEGWRRGMGALGLSLAALVAGVVGFLWTNNKVSDDIVKYWPVLLILVGALALLQGLLRGVRRP